MEGFQNIGQRIVEVARMAVAAHLYESVNRPLAESETYRGDRTTLRSRSATGGAGHGAADDERDDVRSPRLGDLVSDDEREGLMGSATSQCEAREASD
jgi:hypothetical protein